MPCLPLPPLLLHLAPRCPPPQATKLLKASILKVDVGDLELDEDELAADMAAHAGEGRWGGG